MKITNKLNRSWVYQKAGKAHKNRPANKPALLPVFPGRLKSCLFIPESF
jgi:hypothetical protein